MFLPLNRHEDISQNLSTYKPTDSKYLFFFLNNSRRTAVFIALEEKGTETRTAQFIEGKPGENLYINRSTARHKERRGG
jgi:hypothetical protein